MLILLTLMNASAVCAAPRSRGERQYARGHDPQACRAQATAFSDEQDSLLRQYQRESLDRIAQAVKTDDLVQVQRRCVQLGLSCGDNVKALPKGSEKWRAGRRA